MTKRSIKKTSSKSPKRLKEHKKSIAEKSIPIRTIKPAPKTGSLSLRKIRQAVRSVSFAKTKR